MTLSRSSGDDMEAKGEDWDKWLEGIRRSLSTGNLGSHGVG